MTKTSFEELHRIATKEMDVYATLTLRLSEEYNIPFDDIFELGEAAATAYATHKAMIDNITPVKKSFMDRLFSK